MKRQEKMSAVDRERKNLRSRLGSIEGQLSSVSHAISRVESKDPISVNIVFRWYFHPYQGPQECFFVLGFPSNRL